MKIKAAVIAALVTLSLWAQTPAPAAPGDPMGTMNEVAEHYVKLVLALGKHDADYVDAYYGPTAWREEVEANPKELKTIDAEVAALQAKVAAIEAKGLDAMGLLRHAYQAKQLASMRARIAFLGGQKMSFDEEAAALYDAAPPHHDEAHFKALIAELDALLPGEGDLHARFSAFHDQFVIPPDKLDTVFRAAVDEARRRTRARLSLPESESFVIEYVKGKSWSGYNWYKGNAHSLIQVNTDFPIYIERAIDLACHEGYPGHHVYNALLEKHLVRDRGWLEFSVYALFSPQSLIAEGSANYGIQVAFTHSERLAFERDTLFPLAGLDPNQVEAYYKVMAIVGKLNYAGNEAARGYLDGKWTREQAVDWMVRYGLYARDRAEQRLRFIDTYRAYVINYNLGQDLVDAYIKANGGDSPDKVWTVFGQLLSSPRLPSGLR